MSVYILYPTKRFVANAPPVNFLVNFGIVFFSDPPNWASAVSEKRFGRRRCRKNILGVGGVGKKFWASAVSEARFGRRRRRKHILGVGGVGKTFVRTCVRTFVRAFVHTFASGSFENFSLRRLRLRTL